MKKCLFLLVAFVTMASACASDDWKSKVGLPKDCTNPVFTRPEHMNPEGRVRGAGICMNDGEAYTSRGCGFSSEWHYAPKLSLCGKEKDVIKQVMGLYVPEHDTRPVEPLKFCVVTHHGCGAVVVYRAFDNYRYSNIQSENLEQFIAVYDSNGNLTDAMMMGYDEDLYEMLNIEPHMDYNVPHNMGRHDMKFDKTGEHFTIYRYWYLKDKGEGVPEKVEMKRYYTITADGKIRLDKVTNNSEGHDTESKYDNPGALMSEVANPAAVEMMEMMLTPMSDSQILPRLDKTCAMLLDNKLVRERLMHLGMMVYNRNPKSFLAYAYEKRTQTLLVKLLQYAKAYKGSGCNYENCLMETVYKFSPSTNAYNWFNNKLK